MDFKIDGWPRHNWSQTYDDHFQISKNLMISHLSTNIAQQFPNATITFKKVAFYCQKSSGFFGMVPSNVLSATSEDESDYTHLFRSAKYLMLNSGYSGGYTGATVVFLPKGRSCYPSCNEASC